MKISRNEIIEILLSESHQKREAIAKQISANKFPLNKVFDIIFEPDPVSRRFSWLLNDISFFDNSFAPKTLSFLVENMEDINISDLGRVISKQAFFIAPNLPEELEGKLVDLMFRWMLDPKTNISTTTYAMKALEKMLIKYPELKNEYKESLQEIKEQYSTAFKKRVEKLLNKHWPEN